MASLTRAKEGSKTKKRCPKCDRKMHKKSKTSIGKQRWFCRVCRLSATQKNTGVKQWRYYKPFMRWLIDGRKRKDIAKELHITRNTLHLRFNVFLRDILGKAPPFMFVYLHHKNGQRTTSALEGGINAPLRDIPRRHCGMPIARIILSKCAEKSHTI